MDWHASSFRLTIELKQKFLPLTTSIRTNHIMLNKEQKQEIEERGSNLSAVEQQIENFKDGFEFLNLDRPATIGDGIIQLNDQEVKKLSNAFDMARPKKHIIKFVPASGAASRMFKDLFAFAEEGSFEDSSPAQQFIDGLNKFAFFNELNASLTTNGTSIQQCLDTKNYVTIVKELLNESGLDYGQLPKGLLSFHSYEGRPRTPLEEHLVEGGKYAKGKGDVAHLHLTVSTEHQQKFTELVNKVTASYEKIMDVKLDIQFSQQKKSTDTIAVDLENTPFQGENGELLFRPAGHGALLENLNDLDADVIFVKNIDNIVPDRIKEDTITYKKVLGGLLLQTQQQVHEMLEKLDAGNMNLTTVSELLKNELSIDLGSTFSMMDDANKISAIRHVLDRPIRICGMVKNTGEPGGGPFWVTNSDGNKSLQIAETAQIDVDDDRQSKILRSSTHFNPVDLICATKDYKGNKFDLLKFRDDATGFITQKSKGGRELKAQELPGLWNGAMADWITLFVEVPISTFSPVKTVNDLLKESHQ
jgi:hypothetical protein